MSINATNRLAAQTTAIPNSQIIARFPWEAEPAKKLTPKELATQREIKKQHAASEYSFAIRHMQTVEDNLNKYEINNYLKNSLSDWDSPLYKFKEIFGEKQAKKYYKTNEDFSRSNELSGNQTIIYQNAFFDTMVKYPKLSIKNAQEVALGEAMDYRYAKKTYTDDPIFGVKGINHSAVRKIMNDKAAIKLNSFIADNSKEIKSFEEKNGLWSYAGGHDAKNGQFNKNHEECQKRGYDAVQELQYQTAYLYDYPKIQKNERFNISGVKATIDAQIAINSANARRSSRLYD